MGKLVKKQIRAATNALLDMEIEEVDALIANDRQINGMNKNINTLAEQMIAMRQPMALDLRLALMATSIATELERLGDHAKSTAKRVRRLSDVAPEKNIMNLIEKMSEIVTGMLTSALKAYKKKDIEKAAEVRVKDAEVDDINDEIFKVAIKAIKKNPEDIETLIHIILLSRNFERAGDHIVNIARQVHQIVTGEDLKASS
jgi:phosphate transport system protein